MASGHATTRRTNTGRRRSTRTARRRKPRRSRGSPRRKRRSRGKLIKPRHQRRFARTLTWIVIALQAAMLLTWAVAPTWDPPRLHLLELLWAWMHQPSFYPFVALLVAGPPLTLLALRIPGRHRAALTLAWLCFAGLTAEFFAHRFDVMTRILWWKYGQP